MTGTTSTQSSSFQPYPARNSIFNELSQDPASNTKRIAIVDETSNGVVYGARVAYAVAANDPKPDSRAVAATVMAVADVVYGGLQIAESVIKPGS